MSRGRPLPKASDVVVQALRQRILSERLPVGHRLPSEAELMDDLGLGRATIREGLRLLERDGLIEIKRGPGGGITVRHPDISQVSDAVSVLLNLRNVTLREFLAFRQMVEPAAAGMAAIGATPEQRAAISQAADSDGQLGSIVDLHILIGTSTGNGVLAILLQALHSPFVEHFRVKMIQDEHRLGTIKAHQRIAELIQAGDAEGAERAMRRHLDAYAEFLESTGLIDQAVVPGHDWVTG